MPNPKLLGAILYGAMMGLFLFMVMRPEGELIWLIPDQKGSYARTISDTDYTALVEEREHKVLMIDYDPKLRGVHYLFPIALAFVLGAALYRNQHARVIRPHLDPRIVLDHPRYPDFLREDSDREFFSGTELVSTFSSWLSNCPKSTTPAETNTTEQGGGANR